MALCNPLPPTLKMSIVEAYPHSIVTPGYAVQYALDEVICFLAVNGHQAAAMLIGRKGVISKLGVFQISGHTRWTYKLSEICILTLSTYLLSKYWHIPLLVSYY